MRETGLCCGIRSILVGPALVLMLSLDPERESNGMSVGILGILTVNVFRFWNSVAFQHSGNIPKFSSVGFHCTAVITCANAHSLGNCQLPHRKWVLQCNAMQEKKHSLRLFPVGVGAAVYWCPSDSFVKVTELWGNNYYIINDSFT